MKKLSAVLLFVFCFMASHAQTLFTYGNKSVSRDEFLKAFERNPSADPNRQNALREYLDLYINFKLKVEQAKEEKLDETPEYRTDADNFFKQLTENVLNREARMDALVDEAFDRSKKDLEIAQVFVEVRNADTASAYKKIEEAYAQLKAGKPFEDVAATASSDSATRAAKGYIGYITAFTLPYEIENILYNLKEPFSQPYRSNVGYHIFKIVNERRALGRRKIQQILFPTPSFFTTAEKDAVTRMADSVYRLLSAGTPFEEIASKYGNRTADSFGDNAGIEISVGQYSTDFENHVYALQNRGEISKPFKTSYGYHIVKLLDKELPDSGDQTIAKALIQQRIEGDERLLIARKGLIEKWLQKTKFQPASYNEKQLKVFSDSVVRNVRTGSSRSISNNTLLFSFETKKVYVKDWVKFLNGYKQSMDKNTYAGLMKEFINEQCIDYYRSRLPDYNAELKKQLAEFNEANLLFSAMDKHIWTKAAEDDDGLKKYYEAHKTEYVWGPSVGAIVLTMQNKQTAEEVAAKMKAAPAQWRNIISTYGSNVFADSSRFEKDQLEGIENTQVEKGAFSGITYNSSNNTYSFFRITDIYPDQDQRSFEDARGMVINDYQKIVEDKWTADLRKKYPVKVDYDVFKGIK